MAFTYFFRDMQTLEMIRDYAVPALKKKGAINVWDAGCAMGPEPYSLAIMLHDHLGENNFRNVKITATDIDGSNLFRNIIERGVYPRNQVERIPPAYLERYFAKIEDTDFYKISEDLTSAIEFKKHDLLSLIPVCDNSDIILCKNVLLHFSREERVRVMRMFYDNLAEGGYFVSEQTQKLPAEFEDCFEQTVPNAQIYRKKALAVRMEAAGVEVRQR